MIKHVALLFCITFVTISAMEQELPSRSSDLSSAEREYSILLETKLVDFYNKKFGINFNKSGENNPLIARLVIAMINRDFVLENPNNKKYFTKLYNNPKTRLNASDYITVHTRIADEAACSVLAERRSLAYIMTGSYNQPWPVRPEFDQELKQVRTNLGLTRTHKMENPWITEILHPAQATWKAKSPQAKSVYLLVNNFSALYERDNKYSDERYDDSNSSDSSSGNSDIVLD